MATSLHQVRRNFAYQIEQIVPLVHSRKRLSGEDKDRAEQIAADLGKSFCRRCGYCQPCPNDIPISMAMSTAS